MDNFPTCDRTLEDFDFWWKKISRLGHCDAFGSAEWRRVQDEWIEAGLPDEIHRFIYERANIGSQPSPSFFAVRQVKP